MINSHYIPQFILRNFYFDDKITYCDLEEKTVQDRNTRSIFSEEGYYPEGIEKDLCLHAERQFANLYHNKMENAGSNVTFTADELFTIKKYLIVSAVRYKYEISAEDKERGKELGKAFEIDYDKCLHDILACKKVEDVFGIMAKTEKFLFSQMEENADDVNVHLWAEINDIIKSYLVFVRPKGDEKFLIPDVGRGIYKGHLGILKTTAIVDTLQRQYDPMLANLLQMISPRDYTVYPLSRNLAILSMCSFFKLFTNSEFRVKIKLPEEYPSLSAVLEFGDSNAITPPKVMMKNGKKEYKYEIKKLEVRDICHFNSLMIGEAIRYVACADLGEIQRSVELADAEYTTRDLSFMKR